MESSQKLHRKVLNRLFVESLGDAVVYHSDYMEKPLLLDLIKPFPMKLRVYLYNLTNPKGGRSKSEYKMNLMVPNQDKKEKGNFDYSDNRTPLMVAFANLSEDRNKCVFVFFDANKHRDFAHSSNNQVSSEAVVQALCEPFGVWERGTGEIVFTARPSNILIAINQRIQRRVTELLEESNELEKI